MRTSTDAEYHVLTTERGQALLAEACRVRVPAPKDLERWRREASAEVVSAAVRIAECRVRARAKFRRADQMWLEPVGLEQATAEPVARHKARRFAGSLVVDLCSGIGGDSLALAAQSKVVAVDMDHGTCRRTLWNAEVYEVADTLVAVQARAERFALPPASLVHVDPDRRARSKARAREVQGYMPGPGFLRELARRVRGGAIKLGPASDFATHFDVPGYECELVSLDGECKEATIWFGELARCRRRATCLPDGATWSDRDAPREGFVPIVAPSTWMYDPDPTLGRSGLLDAFATAHGLGRCASGIDFLTSEARVVSPFLEAFETREVLPLDLKRIKRRVSELGLGPLEIKTKGVDLTPEGLRPRLDPPGPHPATLLLIGGNGPRRAILAHRATR